MTRLFPKNGSSCFWGAIILAFIGSLLWAKSRSAFSQREFTLSTPMCPVHGIVITPKAARQCPVVIFVYGSGEDLLRSGDELRSFAEMGFAAVSFEYDKQNQSVFDQQIRSLQAWLSQQGWAERKVAWIGFSLGAQRLLSFALRYPNQQPDLLVRLGGGWVPELENGGNALQTTPLIRCPLLLVHGQADPIFDVRDTRKLAEFLLAHGTRVDLKVLPQRGHGFGEDRQLVLRVTAEYWRHLSSSDEQIEIYSEEWAKKNAWPFFIFIAPALLWTFIWLYLQRTNQYSAQSPTAPWDRALWFATAALAMAAIGKTAIHVITPRLEITPNTLAIARGYLVSLRWQAEFEALLARPVWAHQKLQVLLDHAELANYERELMYSDWRFESLDRSIYNEFVLSPTIESNHDQNLGWRRELWENFYPRIRKERDVASAAAIVVRFLRQRVTINERNASNRGVLEAWRAGVTDKDGFERVYIAALRSVGIPARLNPSWKTEFWEGSQWCIAPRPLLEHWRDFTRSD